MLLGLLCNRQCTLTNLASHVYLSGLDVPIQTVGPRVKIGESLVSWWFVRRRCVFSLCRFAFGLLPRSGSREEKTTHEAFFLLLHHSSMAEHRASFASRGGWAFDSLCVDHPDALAFSLKNPAALPACPLPVLLRLLVSIYAR